MTEREKTADKALELFANGFHCSQAVLCACANLFREEPPPPELIAAMAPFAGGMGSSGQVCGTLSGALAAIGFTLGKTEPQKENHKQMCGLSYAMMQKFAEIAEPYGGINCSDIADVDWKNREAVQYFRKNPDSSRKNCVKVVRETSTFLYDLIAEKIHKE
jgi:C_GCAxxG_C_C family probable redox protein